ncbi:hypothetical protein GPALN_007719 [Globodera pallida]|nr:hypothetical protein GPALN_007719 [Globodera pallida]
MNKFAAKISFIVALLAICAIVSGEINGERPVRAAAQGVEVEVIDPMAARLRATRACRIDFCYDRCPGQMPKNPC